MSLKEQLLEELKGQYSLDEDLNDPDNLPPTEAQLKFAEELKALLQSLVLKSDLTEELVSDRGAKEHFEKHCLARDKSKVSTRSRVYYDFKDVSQYKARENLLNRAATDITNSKTDFIGSLTDTEFLQNLFHKFFEGGRCLHFSALCGIVNNAGEAALVLRSYATEVTANYPQNTVDLLILGHHNKTVTMYPVDANYLETKFNNVIRHYTGWKNYYLKINH